MKSFSFYFLFLLFGVLVVGLNASTINSSNHDYTDVFYTFGALMLGSVFSNNFKTFLKSSSSRLFKKSDSPEYDESNPPIQKSEGPVDDGGGSGGLDDKLSALQSALESGEVEANEESIRGWCSSNGVNEEDTNYIVSALLDEPEMDMQKSDSEQPELPHEDEDFEKSLIKYFKVMEDRIISTEKKLTGFEKSLRNSESKLASKDKEIQFLKSEIGKLSKEPVGVKTPIKESIAKDGSNGSRTQIIGTIKKGMSQGLMGLDELLAYESKGILPENFKLIKE